MMIRKPHMMARRRAAEMRAKSLQKIAAPVAASIGPVVTQPVTVKKKVKR
jgi:hypothetical protein